MKIFIQYKNVVNISMQSIEVNVEEISKLALVLKNPVITISGLLKPTTFT